MDLTLFVRFGLIDLMIELSEEQILVLKQAHKVVREKKLADRIKAVLYLHYGLSYEQTAKLLMLDETTLRRYVTKFQEKGIDGLLEYRYVGGLSKLTHLQENEVREYLRQNTARTASEVAEYIKKQYEVLYTTIGVTKLLHRLGFVYKKPKVVPGKADRIKQEEFVKQYLLLKKSLGPKDQIYYLDATHPTHNTKASYGWILKGKANDKYIKTNTGRERLNLNGALNLTRNTKPIVLEEKTINSQATIRLLNHIKWKQKQGKVYIILDNASYHHSKEIKHWLFRRPRFKLIYLPPYSPNLNPIERLWKFYHQEVTNNHYFESFKEFKTKSLDFFKNLKPYQQQLSSLLTDNFQLLPDLNLQT